MFTVLFSILALMALLSICSLYIMKVRLAKRAPSLSGKFAWWGAGSDEVVDAYRRIFPRSCLPYFIQIPFLLLILAAVVFLIAILLK